MLRFFSLGIKMMSFALLVIAGSLSIFCISATAQDNTVSSLKQYIGQQPGELFKQEPKVLARLEKLLGKDYDKLQERFAHGLPIELFGDVLILRGEKPFTPGNPKVVVGIGLFTNKIHCALIESTSRSIYSEDIKKIPNEFNKFIIISDKRSQEEAEKKKKSAVENADKK